MSHKLYKTSNTTNRWLQCENTPLNYAAYKYAETSGYVDNIYKALDNDLETYAKIQHFQLKGEFSVNK